MTTGGVLYWLAETLPIWRSPAVAALVGFTLACLYLYASVILDE